MALQNIKHRRGACSGPFCNWRSSVNARSISLQASLRRSPLLGSLMTCVQDFNIKLNIKLLLCSTQTILLWISNKMIYYEGIANEFSDEWSKIFTKIVCITTSMANWKDWINPHLKRIPEIIEKKCCPVPIEKSRENKILSKSHSPFLLIYNT